MALSDSPFTFNPANLSRRSFLQITGSSVAAVLASRALGAPIGADENQVKLSPLSAATEARERPEAPALPPEKRVGFAVVGLGRIALERVLPAFGRSKYAKVTALVSGSREKALKVARQYGISEQQVYDYDAFSELGSQPAVKAVYLALPNGLHAEYTLKAAHARKHVLCEKPMATSVGECQQMIDGCREGGVKLLVAYRSQYEPFDRALQKLIRQKKLGTLREIISANSQNQGDPKQWRLNRKLAGGGPLPDVGLYSLNAARFLSGEEPVEAWGSIYQPKDDPRFREVEATAQFGLRFPSGLVALATCSYASHRSQFLRVQGAEGWAELNPAFAYDNLQLRHGTVVDGIDQVSQISLSPKDQFATEIDHFADSILSDREPLTRGEEGLQDQRIIEAIYQAARSGSVVKLNPPVMPVRGPALEEST